MNYLIFGGAGFIGINFVKSIISCNNNIIVFDKLTDVSNKKQILNLQKRHQIDFINDDICNKKRVFDCIKEFKPSYIVNFAAETHVDNSIENPDNFIKTNIIGTYTILQTLKNLYFEGILKNFRYLNISTDEVFGSLNEDDQPFSENSKYYPNSPYSASKASADHLVRSYYETFGLPVITTNCSNNFGPYQHFEKLIPMTIKKCLKKEKIPVYGDGKNKRDWIFVQDHCNAIKLILKNGILGQTYNIGGNNELRNIDLINMICDYLDKVKPQVEGISYSNLISYVKDRPGHDKRYAVDSRKIISEFNWGPKTTFKEGLENTINWYIKNLK